jgi:hypothetical protein
MPIKDNYLFYRAYFIVLWDIIIPLRHKILFMVRLPLPPHELAPRQLSPEETENPWLVIHDLFSYDHLPGIRDMLWQWLKATVTGSYHKHLEKLVEAVHLLHLRNREAAEKHNESITPL